MLDTTADNAMNAALHIPNPPTTLPAMNMHSMLTEFSISPDCQEKTLEATLFSTTNSNTPGDSSDEQMQQPECCFLAHPAKLQQTFEQNLMLAQQEFKENMQTFITQCNATHEYQTLHLPAPSQFN